jgi:1-aminocyclopropane-1-carboxylate deaminase/D-cysteine desulfhydrase-like pyridoxal-dependent ACC family enzyme
MTIANNDSVAGPGYGVLTDERRSAMRLAVDLEGLMLDPVYTATGMAGLIRLAATGELSNRDTVVFIHTGGLPALFAYGEDILAP